MHAADDTAGLRVRRSLESADEEDRVPVVRALVGLAVFAGPFGLGCAHPVDRACGGRRGAGCRRCLLPGPPLRPAARLAIPAPCGDRRSHQAHRDRDGRHRHALREPAVHGRGRRCRGPHRGRPPAARDQPRLTRAGHRRLPLFRVRPDRRADRRRHGPPARRGLPPGTVRRRVRPAQPHPDVREPARPPPPRAARARAARPDLVGCRIARDRGMGRHSRV